VHLHCAAAGERWSRRIEFDVDRTFDHPHYYAFPVTDVGFNRIRYRGACAVEMAAYRHYISGLKRRGIHTSNEGLAINSENPCESVVFYDKSYLKEKGLIVVCQSR
jgi:hypothetical protein